jgi:hypothetical protein
MKCFVTIFERFSWAIPLCKDLTAAGLEVILIDNNSTYPPCVEWLKNCEYKVERMNYNAGPWAFVTTDLHKQYLDRYYFLCDSDLDISKVPKDFPDHLMYGLENTGGDIWKAGLSFELNDLPDNIVTRQAIAHENAFWVDKTELGFYKAWIDIGCTLHDRSRQTDWYYSIRSDRPYTGRHLDWYHTEESWREEDTYFLEHTPGYFGWCKKYYDEVVLKLPPR